MVSIISVPQEPEGVDSSTMDEARVYRKVAWRLIPFLMLCYAVAYLDRVNIGFAKLGMSADLHLSETVYGLGAGIFFIGYFIFEVPSNAMLHKVGARRWIARIMISWALLSAACSLISGPTSFYILRCLLGLAEAGFFPGIILYLTYWFPSERRGQVVALFMIAIPLAGLVGSPLSGAVMMLGDGWLGWSGWRWMFVLESIPALLLGCMVPFVLDSHVREARWLSDAEKKVIADALARNGAEHRQAHAGLRDLISDPLVLRFAAIYFCCVMGQYGVTFWLPTMLAKVGHGTALTTGLFTALPYGCAVLSMVLICRHSDKTGERRWHLALPMLIGGIGMLLAPSLGGNVLVSLLMFSIATAATLTATPMFWTLPTATLSGTAAAVGIAAINSIGNLAGFLSPILIGWITDKAGSVAAGMGSLTVLLTLGALLTLTTPRKQG